MNEPQFLNQTKNWIYHKVMLSTHSPAFKEGDKRNAMIHVKKLFTNFLNYPNKYGAGQIALLIKRHEGLLETILPIPQNPTYETSVATLTRLLEAAGKIISHYNLTL